VLPLCFCTGLISACCEGRDAIWPAAEEGVALDPRLIMLCTVHGCEALFVQRTVKPTVLVLEVGGLEVEHWAGRMLWFR